MASLYANENFPLPAVETLRKLGHDVLTVQETGKANQSTSDDEVLAFAVDRKRALLTLNRQHFIRLHKQRSNHFGIVVCTFDPDFDALAQRVHTVLETDHNLEGKLLRVNRPAQ